MNILTQAPPTEPNPELWLKQQEYSSWFLKVFVYGAVIVC